MTLRAAAAQLVSIATVRASENCGCVTDASPNDTDLGVLIDQASDALAVLSNGKVFGRQTSTFYPCRIAQTRCGCDCGCGLDAIPLDVKDPVIGQVKIDGVVLAASEYGLHTSRDGRWNLVRVATGDRPTSWPSSQSMWRPDSEDDTFSITVTYGEHTEWIIEQAALELVCDFASEDIVKSNQVSAGATSANVGGVNISFGSGYTLAERLERLQAGDLGPAVTRFMSVYAPAGRRVSEVWAPELETWGMTVKQ